MKLPFVSIAAILIGGTQAWAQSDADIYNFFCAGENWYQLERGFYPDDIAEKVDAKFTEQIQLLKKLEVPASVVAELVEIKANVTLLPWGKKGNGADWAVAEKQVWKECVSRMGDLGDPLYDWMQTRKGAEYFFTIGYVALKSVHSADAILEVDEDAARNEVTVALSDRILGCGKQLNLILQEARMAEVRNKTSIDAANEFLKIISVASKLTGEKPTGLLEADIVKLRAAGLALQDLAKNNQLIDPLAKPGRTLNIAPADF